MIDRHPAGWVLGERRVTEDSAKALYDSYPDGEKSDFFAAYVYLKYIDHFIHHALVAYGLSPKKRIENKFANMVEGSYKQGAYDSLQMGYVRPNEECADHITPIKNLYLGGASSFSGGRVTFGPGVCTANRVVKDIGADKWWPEPDHVIAARAKGMPL